MKIKEFILELLSVAKFDGVSFRSICKKLSLTSSPEKQALLDVLSEMEKDKVIIEYSSKFFLPQYSNLIEGKVKRHERGFAFLIRTDGEADLFIPPKYLNGAYQGDKVLVKKTAFKGGSSDEAEVVKILERGVNRLTGAFFAEKMQKMLN